jgi:predicted Rossmann fold flavoprotein
MKVAVIGAGAAGYFAAIHAALGGASVVLLEKTGKTLSKVKISGGGRCNVTHAAFENSKLVKNYPRGEKFLKKVFKEFAVKDTVDWFESRGVPLKVEADGRMFPITNSSQSIIDALQDQADKVSVKVILNHGVEKISLKRGKFQVITKDKDFEVDRLIISSGGSPKETGFAFMSQLGHKIVPPIPSLFTFNTPNEPLRNLMGLSVPDAYVRLEGTKLAYNGPLLITHWGLSGPAVLKLSSYGANWLHEKNYLTNVHIRWNKDWTEEQLTGNLQNFKNQHPKKKISSNPLFGLPARLWGYLCKKSDIDEELLWQNLAKKHFHKLVQNLFCYIVSVKGKTTFKEEFVTAGGVDLSEVDPETMESKLIQGLFFAGEVLDVDGITGGFNFQAAWSTGYLAGTNAIL